MSSPSSPKTYGWGWWMMVVVDKKSFRLKFKSGMEVPVEL